MERKCVAVVLSKPNKKYQSDILKGIYKRAFERNFNVAVFYTTLKRGTEKYINCELDIISLINLEKLAGVIYLPDTFEFTDTDGLITAPLKTAAKEKGVPLITIDYEIPDVPCLLGSDDQMTADIIDHLIEKHGCTDIAYMTGFKGHQHAERRLGAYKRSMEAHGLDVTDDRIYYGDFWTGEGDNFVKALLESPRGLPQAIACANNYMAESVYKAITERGIKVPDDILITGFSDEGTQKISYISSCVKINSITGEEAFELIYDMINGKKPPKVTCTCSHSINNFSITCGCKSAGDYNYMLGKGLFIEEVGGYFSETNTMNEDLYVSKDYEDMIWKLDYYTIFLNGVKSFYLCFCKDWNKPDLTQSDRYVPKVLTDEMYLYYYRRYTESGELERYQGMEKKFPLSDIFPFLNDPKGDPAAYVFRILHFQDHCFGYAVISYGNETRTPDDFYDFWLKDLATAMESQRIQHNARTLYRKIEENAVTDLMTGLYNRNGFNSMFPEILSSAKERDLRLLFVIGDMNGLKYINDTFGHIAGDEGIKKSAELFSSVNPENSVNTYNYRIGGDEFVKISTGRFSEADIQSLLDGVRNRFDEYDKSSGKPYPLHISLGAYLKDPEEDITPDGIISKADKCMYEDKVRVKEKTGFDPKR